MSYYYPAVRMTNIKKTDNAGKDVEELELSYNVECEIV